MQQQHLHRSPLPRVEVPDQSPKEVNRDLFKLWLASIVTATISLVVFGTLFSRVPSSDGDKGTQAVVVLFTLLVSFGLAVVAAVVYLLSTRDRRWRTVANPRYEAIREASAGPWRIYGAEKVGGHLNIDARLNDNDAMSRFEIPVTYISWEGYTGTPTLKFETVGLEKPSSPGQTGYLVYDQPVCITAAGTEDLPPLREDYSGSRVS